MTFVLFSRVMTGGLAVAQAPVQVYRPDAGLAAYFSGEWEGEGAFAQGSVIKASLSFHVALDSAWLVGEYRDWLPHLYKASSWWGVDGATGQFVAYVFDNSQGHRQFVTNGWVDGRMVLSGRSYLPRVGVVFEHFIYERESDKAFKLTYETSRDGVTWRMGDWLVFRKKG